MALFSLLSFLVTTSLGTLYPIYLSYKAIKNNNLQSLEILLMFWIVMGIINAVESTFGWFLHWVPFFYQLKTIFLLWLTLPQIQGSTYVYVTYVHPFLLEHEVEIDTWLIEVKEKCRNTGTAYFYQFLDKLKEVLLQAFNASENDHRRINEVQQSQASNVQAGQMDMASAYAMNWIRQFGPAASAIFQPMQNRPPDSYQLRPQNYPSTLDHQSSFSTSRHHDASFRTQPDGYQIPDYDEIVVKTLRSTETSTSSRRPPISSHPSSESLRNGQAQSVLHRGNNLTMSGYEEIGRDEASGSENDSLINKAAHPRMGSSTSLLNQRSRLSDGNHLPLLPKSADQAAKRSTSAGSKWFNWSSKSSSDVADSKKKN